MFSFSLKKCLFRNKLINVQLNKHFLKINSLGTLVYSKCINSSITPNISSLNRYTSNYSCLYKQVDKESSVDTLPEIISSLINDENSHHRVRIETVIKAIELMHSNECKLDDSVFLIKCCGDLMPNEKAEVKHDLARKIIQILLEKSQVDLQHYHAILDVLKENDCNVSAIEFLSSIPLHIIPDVTTYEKLLHCACNCGDISQSTTIISEMKKLNYPVSEDVFNSLILGHGLAGDLANARAVVDTMLTTQIYPSEKTYIALLKGLAGSAEPYQILQTLREADSKQIKFDTKGLFEVVLQLAMAGHDKYIPNILLALPNAPPISMIHTFCTRLIYKGAPRAAFTVFCELVKVERSPVLDADTYGAFLIHEMILADTDVKTIIDICDSLMSSGKNIYALHVAYMSAVKEGSSSALPLIQAMKEQEIELRPHYFWPLIIAISDHSGDAGVMGILRAMQNLKVKSDMETFLYYVFPRLDLSDPVLAIRKLHDLRFTMAELLQPMMSYLLHVGQINECLKLVQAYDKTSINGKILMKPLINSFKTGARTNDIVAIIKALKAEVNVTSADESTAKQYNDWAGQFALEIISTDEKRIYPKTMLHLLKCYKSVGIKISGFAADIISDYFTKQADSFKADNLELLLNELRSPKLTFPSSELFNQFIPHPRDMDLDTLENHLTELRSKKMNTRGVLRRLLQAHCRKGNYARAQEILEECENNRMILSPGMQACVFDLHVKTKNLERAEQVLRDLRRQAPWFKIDEYKMIDYATVLIREGNIKGSINVLKQYCVDHNVVGGEHISQNCWRLLSALAETGTAKQVRDVLEELVELRFCAKNNTMLGPVIRAHLNKNDLEGAVNEYVACVNECNSTPLQLELMTLLTKRNETDLLQTVVDATKKVHGVVSAMTTLVIALASANKKNELRRLLTDSSSRVSPIYLRQRCERLEIEGNVQPMLVLAKVCKDIPQFIPDDIYEKILRVHCRQNNYEAVIDLYNSMLENDEKPSVEFLYHLINFLQNNKYPLPKGLTEPQSPSSVLKNKVRG